MTDEELERLGCYEVTETWFLPSTGMYEQPRRILLRTLTQDRPKAKDAPAAR